MVALETVRFLAFAGLVLYVSCDVSSPGTEGASPSLVLALDKAVEVQVAGNALAPGTKISGGLFDSNFFPGFNFFGSIGRVPPGYGNVDGPDNVPLSDQQVEFGYAQPTTANPQFVISADINTAGVITLSYRFTTIVSFTGVTVTLKSSAFQAFRYLEAISSNMNQPVNASLVGDTVTISTTRQFGFNGHITQAVFKLRQCWYEGKCCDTETGLFKPRDTVCRRKTSSCDVAEYCTGHDADCPADRDAEDGAKCLWYAPDDSDYGRYSVDTSSLKRTIVDASRTASTTAKHEDEVCLGHCKEGKCHMSKRAAACCTPAAEEGHGASAMSSGSLNKVTAKTQHYCWE